MSCTCTICEEHWRVLDLTEPPESSEQIREAYIDAVKVWHPDRFENDARLRAKAEARFKSVQVAYRELLEHLNIQAHLEKASSAPDETASAESAANQPTRESTQASEADTERASYDVFSADDRCYVSPYIPHNVRATLSQALGGRPLADLLVVIDLSGGKTVGGRKNSPRDLSRFLALSPHGLFLRDDAASGFVPYSDIDASRLTLQDHGQSGLSGWWPKGIDPGAARRPRLSLEIFSRSGKHIFTLDTPASDAVKQAAFHFIRARIPAARS